MNIKLYFATLLRIICDSFEDRYLTGKGVKKIWVNIMIFSDNFIRLDCLE